MNSGTWNGQTVNLQKRARDIRGTAHNVLGYSMPEMPWRADMAGLELWLEELRIDKESEVKQKRLVEW
eukprot:4742692-Amphidinium_carterae.1